MPQQPPPSYAVALIEIAAENNLTDSDISRAHNRAYENSKCSTSTIQRFRHDALAGERRFPTELIEDAYAAALHKTSKQLWRDVMRRYRQA